MHHTFCITSVLRCIERGDLYDDDCDSDDDSHDEDENRIVFETGTDERDALKDFVWENL